MSETEDAPDRIWVYAPTIPDHNSWIYTNPPPAVAGFTEYVRADLVQAKDAEIARLRDEVKHLRGLEQNTYDKWKDVARDLTAERDAALAEIARLRAELDAALAKAWGMGRDAAADCCDEYYRVAPTGMEAECLDAQLEHTESVIRALTPPGDLAAKIGGE